jgi:Uma2 family endonuclease
MSGIKTSGRWISPEEYLEGEKVAAVRHEYLAGVVYAMAGASKVHNQLAQNIAGWLRAALRGKPCQSFMEGVKVRLAGIETVFYYPDVFVACDPRDTDEYFCDYPAVVFEVLSADTHRFDRLEKRRAYQTIETLQTYILVDQHKVEVSVWQRGGEAEPPTVHTRLDESVALPGLGLTLPLAEIYTGVALTPEKSAPPR